VLAAALGCNGARRQLQQGAQQQMRAASRLQPRRLDTDFKNTQMHKLLNVNNQ